MEQLDVEFPDTPNGKITTIGDAVRVTVQPIDGTKATLSGVTIEACIPLRECNDCSVNTSID